MGPAYHRKSEPLMPKTKKSSDQNLLLFPSYGTQENAAYDSVPSGILHGSVAAAIAPSEIKPLLECEVVLSGTYRKDFESLKRTYEEFRDLGCTILSPSNVTIVSEQDGFVYMHGEERETPENIEARHLAAIQKANFVWLHTPEGYVGPTAALEVGFANAIGVPVYAKESPKDKILQSFVRVVSSPIELVSTKESHPETPAPALKAFQEYYRRAAMHRGYGQESAKDTLLLMVEEVGELARAIRKREKLTRHGSYPTSNEAQELADVFLYVVHMANILGLDLGDVVKQKEYINIEKFLGR